MRHSSLNGNVLNMYVIFEGWVLHSEKDIHVQKIKCKNNSQIYFSLSHGIDYLFP